MAFYKQPIRPFDPVNEDDKDNQSSRYYRDSFDATGQDSKTNPPSQDQSQWELLTNIMPITRGGLDRRWGYSVLATGLTAGATHLYSFQRDSDLLRQIVATGPGVVESFNESGPIYDSDIFNPVATPRMVNSRSFGYFFSGNQADLVKWNGNPGLSSGVSNWGISFLTTSITGQSPAIYAGLGANGPGNIALGWQAPTNAEVKDNVTSIANLGSGQGATIPLVLSNYTGFSIPTAATILGIRVTITGALSLLNHDNIPRYFQVSLAKFGTPVGNSQLVSVPAQFGTANLAPFLVGGVADLWGSGWNPNDFNNGNVSLSIIGTTNGTGVGSQVTSWAIDAAAIEVFYTASAQAISTTTGGAGAITLTVGRIYYTVYYNSTTGNTSDLSPASGSTGPVTNSQINLTNIPVSTDPQVDSKIILATADGGDPSALYQVAIIPNAQTTYTDNAAETALVLNQLWAFTDEFGNEFGVPGNTPPPNGTLCVKHKGRLWMAVGQNLFFSKATSELTLPNGFIAGKYEEAWPRDTYLDISEGAETVAGLLSNGQALFIGTQRHIRWVTGDDPSNFSEPEIIHAEVGLLNQEVWQSVFIQGTPAGCMWLTPDHRVIGSDFNSYHDVGNSIQDVLGSINPIASVAPHAMFVSDGEFDLYILAIPTGTNTSCDTLCVFNMRAQQWVIWKVSDLSAAMLFNVAGNGTTQWMFASGTNVFRFASTSATDNGNPIPLTARTSWLHLGAPTHRKLLDELEVVGDTAMTVTVEAGTPQRIFTPNDTRILKTNVPLKISPFGQQKVYLASSGAKDRYFRFTFSSFGTSSLFLRSFNIKSIPFNTL